MTLAHAAAGAAIGSRIRSRRAAVLACVGAHGLLDLPAHDDLDEAGEGVLTLATIALTARLFGVRSREFWCGFACSMPDLEHVVLRGRRLRFYPSHRFARLHDSLPGPRATRARPGRRRARRARPDRARAAARVSEAPANLAGQLLIAEPRLADPNFRRSVVLVLAHDAEGALGRRAQPPHRGAGLRGRRGARAARRRQRVLHDGGPVQRDGVVVLADFAEPEESERLVVGSVGMLSDLSEPERLSESVRRVRAFAGYAGWGAGQLEGELQREDWFLEPARVDDVFSADPGELWSSVLERKGGSYRLVSRMPDDPSLNYASSGSRSPARGFRRQERSRRCPDAGRSGAYRPPSAPPGGGR